MIPPVEAGATTLELSVWTLFKGSVSSILRLFGGRKFRLSERSAFGRVFGVVVMSGHLEFGPFKVGEQFLFVHNDTANRQTK